MIKRTMYFGNPTYLSMKDKQLHIHINNTVNEKRISRPIEDIGVIILDNSQITISHNAIKALVANKTAIISCDDKHMPASLTLPLEGHTQQSERYRHQVEASLPLRKNLWQQTIKAKIRNQKAVLDTIGKPSKRLAVLEDRVSVGDAENVEGQAAAYYWATFIDGFTRDRSGDPPNALLNYGYAIVRSMVARALVASGLLPTLGIHHRNKYNAYCLADDIMEPYRPFVDLIAYDIYHRHEDCSFLTKDMRARLLAVATVDALFGKKKSPLMVGMSLTSASLAQCYLGEKRRILYPKIITS